MRSRLALAFVLAAAAVVTTAGRQTMPPPPPPTIWPVVPPTTPQVPTVRPIVPGVTGPGTRSTASLILGQVVDTSGRGVPKAVVRLIGDRVIDTVLTDPKGRFYFNDIPLGEVVVTAEKLGYFDGGYGQRRATGLPMPFSVPYGQTMTNMRIEVFRSGVITGSVTDEAGEPMVGVRVVAFRRQFVAGLWQYAAADSEDTDDQGFYRLYGLRPGEYVISVPSSEFTTPAKDAVLPDDAGPANIHPTVFYPATDQRILALPIALAAGDVRYAVDFRLPAVRAWRVTGRLVGNPEAVANQQVALVPADAAWASADGAGLTTSAFDGTFTFPRVAAGRYQLQAGEVSPIMRIDAGGAGAAAEAPQVFCASADVTVNDADVELSDIEMRLTAAIAGRIDLERAAAGPETAAPPRRIAIVIEPAESGLSRATTFDAAADGVFSVSNLIPGKYFVRTGPLPRGWFLKSLTASGDDAMDDPIDLRVYDMSVAVTLTTRATEIIGTVRDSRMQAASGAAVIIVPMTADGHAIWTPNRVRETRASTSGVFNVKGLPPGDYLVVAIDDAAAEGWQDPQRLAALRQLATRFTLHDSESLTLLLQLK